MYSRDEGIQAIIELQALAGIAESPEKAGLGWDGMSPTQRLTTENVHRVVCKQPTVPTGKPPWGNVQAN